MPRAKKIQTGFLGEDNILPESKRFGGSAEADEAFDSRPIMDCHVGGVPFRDLPLLAQRMLTYERTDEGYKATNAGRPAPIQMTDALDKTLKQRGDELRAGKDPRHAAQPLRFLDKYKRPGMSQKLLSTKSGELNPDYEPILKANGDPLKYKGMIVGERPTEDVEDRNAYYQGRSAAKLDQLSQAHRENGGIVSAEK